jgi:signal transduction histidine kinase
MAYHRTAPRWAWPAAGVSLAAIGSAWLVQADLAARRDAFDTDARIVHRLLSQQAAQHDAVLATLALLQPGDAGATSAAPEQRLPALYPQVLKVLRRGADEAWPAALAGAEAESAAARRPVLAEPDLARGQYTLVQAGVPSSYAMRIDAGAAVPWSDWPLARDGPVRVVLALGGRSWVLQAGRSDRGIWQLSAEKRLASDSQPFTVLVTRAVHAGELPWGRLLLWCIAAAAAAAALAAWQRQREAARRAEELLRLGQVGRLNALGELAAGMAHELNQPLTAVLASTQAAQRLLEDPEGPDLATARRALTQSVQQARRAADVVARLRRLVQPADSGAATVPVRLRDAVDGALYLLSPQIGSQAVKTELQGLDDVPAVQADPVALEQIVHNLMLNALQALTAVPPGRRRLILGAASAGERVVLSVRDTGPGFPQGAMERLFEPFFTTREGGLGLGLSLCESLAAGMGGTLTARNRAEGGAELTLTLPRASAAPPGNPA